MNENPPKSKIGLALKRVRSAYCTVRGSITEILDLYPIVLPLVLARVEPCRALEARIARREDLLRRGQ